MAITATVEDEMRRAWFRREVLPREPMLRNYARRFQSSGVDGADDLVHDVFVKAIGYEGWAGIENVDAFLRRIMKNIVMDDVRRKKVVAFDTVADLDRLDLADEAPDSERIVLWRDQLRLLQTIIGELPPRARQVMTLRRIDGLSVSDIADRLGISVSTVEKHLTAGLRYCTEALAREAGEERVRTRRALWGSRKITGLRR